MPPTPHSVHPARPLLPVAGRLMVERLDPIGKRKDRAQGRELIWARTAAGRQFGERGLGGGWVPTHTAEAPAAPNPALVLSALNYLPQEARDREEHPP